MKLAPKQLTKFLTAFLGLASVSVTSANSVNITSALTAILATAGDTGRAVPLQQASATQMGVVVTGNNVVQVWDQATLDPILIGGNEVYGRVVFSSPNYSVQFFTDINGTETAATLNQTVKLAVPYRFDFDNLPQDSLVLWTSLAPGAIAGSGGVQANETLTVTGNNTFSNLANTPLNPTTATMTVNGQRLYAGTHFTITGQAISISGGQSTAIGFTITTTDFCVMEYRY